MLVRTGVHIEGAELSEHTILLCAADRLLSSAESYSHASIMLIENKHNNNFDPIWLSHQSDSGDQGEMRLEGKLFVLSSIK